jgi:hypothetical protein
MRLTPKVHHQRVKGLAGCIVALLQPVAKVVFEVCIKKGLVSQVIFV